MPLWNETKNFSLKSRPKKQDTVANSLGMRGALQSSDEAFHALADTMPQMVWSTLPNGDHDYYNARWYQFTGVPSGSTDGDGWEDMFHADDLAEAQTRWSHSLKTGEPYEVEYRLRHSSGSYRWVLGRALPIVDSDNVIQRWIGTCTDIDDAKQTSSQNELLSQELSHRIKNIFSIISSLIFMTARTNEGFREPAEQLRERINALGRAHEYVRPHNEHAQNYDGRVTLHKLLGEIFAAYPAYTDGRLLISGEDLNLNDKVATPLALIFHELATNCMKYGSLTNVDGLALITVKRKDKDIILNWRETGGPVTSLPEHSGFGSKLLDLSVNQQLGGSIDRHWNKTGLEVNMVVEASRLEATVNNVLKTI